MNEKEVIDQSPLAQVAQASAQQSPIAKPTVAATAQPSEYEKAITEYRRQQQQLIERQKELIDSLNVRIQPSDYLSAMSQGFGDPRNLSFASGIAGAAGNVSAIQAAEQKRSQELAKMKLELGMQELGMKEKETEKIKGLSIQDAIQSSFKPLTDESGNTTYQFDPSSLPKIIRAGGSFEDIAKIGKSIPDLKRAGMLGGASVEGTPFDAIALMAPNPELKAHAERLQKQYKSGAFKDEESAERASQQLLQMMTSHMDRQQQMQFQQGMQAIMVGLRQDQQRMNMEKFEDERKSREGKLTDQQKIDYNKIIVPVINEGAKANSALLQIYSLENQIKNAPSGALAGAYASSIGKLFGTDENTALREIERLQKSLLTQVPRLPGAQSNFDSQNLEKAIGRLSDISLTNKQRLDLVTNIKDGFKRLADRANDAQIYWESNRKVAPSLFGKETSPEKPAFEKTIVREGNVTSGPNQGKKVIEYSDGSREYK